MRIVHTCLRYPPASGGAERLIEEIVERTRSIPERDVRVLTSKLRTHHPISELDPELLVADAPHIQRLHHARTPLIAYPRLQALRYYLGHHQPDIIHAHGFWYQPADVAARYAREQHIPLILQPLYYENKIRQKPFWKLYKKTLGQRTFAAASAVIVISPHEQQLIEQVGFSVKQFVLIPPGIAPELFQKEYVDPFIHRNIRGHKLLAVGRIASGKGLSDLIDALPAVLRQQPSTQLSIIGEDFGAKKSLQKQADRLGISSHVHFWGKVSDEELRAAYQHTDVFIHPSHYEAFGIVLAESLAAKTAVVARDVAAIPYVVPHEKAGLLFKTNEELSAHIITLLADSKKRAALAQWGHQHIVDNFTWNTSIKKLVELYEQLTSHHRTTKQA